MRHRKIYCRLNNIKYFCRFGNLRMYQVNACRLLRMRIASGRSGKKMQE